MAAVSQYLTNCTEASYFRSPVKQRCNYGFLSVLYIAFKSAFGCSQPQGVMNFLTALKMCFHERGCLVTNPEASVV